MLKYKIKLTYSDYSTHTEDCEGTDFYQIKKATNKKLLAGDYKFIQKEMTWVFPEPELVELQFIPWEKKD